MKKLISILLLAITVFSFVACGTNFVLNVTPTPEDSTTASPFTTPEGRLPHSSDGKIIIYINEQDFKKYDSSKKYEYADTLSYIVIPCLVSEEISPENIENVIGTSTRTLTDGTKVEYSRSDIWQGHNVEEAKIDIFKGDGVTIGYVRKTDMVAYYETECHCGDTSLASNKDKAVEAEEYLRGLKGENAMSCYVYSQSIEYEYLDYSYVYERLINGYPSGDAVSIIFCDDCGSAVGHKEVYNYAYSKVAEAVTKERVDYAYSKIRERVEGFGCEIIKISSPALRLGVDLEYYVMAEITFVDTSESQPKELTTLMYYKY